MASAEASLPLVTAMVLFGVMAVVFAIGWARCAGRLLKAEKSTRLWYRKYRDCQKMHRDARAEVDEQKASVEEWKAKHARTHEKLVRELEKSAGQPNWSAEGDDSDATT